MTQTSFHAFHDMKLTGKNIKKFKFKGFIDNLFIWDTIKKGTISFVPSIIFLKVKRFFARMSYGDVVRTFSQLEVVHLDSETARDEPSLRYHNPWTARVYQGNWLRGVTAGGCRNNTGKGGGRFIFIFLFYLFLFLYLFFYLFYLFIYFFIYFLFILFIYLFLFIYFIYLFYSHTRDWRNCVGFDRCLGLSKLLLYALDWK